MYCLHEDIMPNITFDCLTLFFLTISKQLRFSQEHILIPQTNVFLLSYYTFFTTSQAMFPRITRTSFSKLLSMKSSHKCCLEPASPALAGRRILAQKTPALRCHSHVQKGQGLSRQGGRCSTRWVWRTDQYLGRWGWWGTWDPAGAPVALDLLPHLSVRAPGGACSLCWGYPGGTCAH